jgi:carbon starvation protein CstA
MKYLYFVYRFVAADNFFFKLIRGSARVEKNLLCFSSEQTAVVILTTVDLGSRSTRFILLYLHYFAKIFEERVVTLDVPALAKKPSLLMQAVSP